jgi:uncharacterized protein YcbX
VWSEAPESTVKTMSDANGIVTSLGVHPVKSARGLTPEAWWFTARGPVMDRRWMLVDEQQRFISLREVPGLARLLVELPGFADPPDGSSGLPGLIRLEIGEDSIEFEPISSTASRREKVVLWKHERVVVPESAAICEWLSGHLQQRVRLVRHDPSHDPWIQEEPEAQGATTGLVDGYPVLFASEATLTAGVPGDWAMRRFRPNITMAGAQAWAEDRWKRIRIGCVELELVKPCVRCVATTVDPESGVRTGPEPLSLLTKGRDGMQKPVFGWNALVKVDGLIRTGDSIEVLEMAPSAGS